MNRLSFRVRRAISPVIAVVLMIALVVAAIGVVWLLFSNFTDTNPANISAEGVEYFDLDSNKQVDMMRVTLLVLSGNNIDVESFEITVDDVPVSNWVLVNGSKSITSNKIIFKLQTVDPGSQLTSGRDNVLMVRTNVDYEVYVPLEVPSGFTTKIIGESGSVMVGAAEVTVNLSNIYRNPVVVVTPVANGSTTVRSGTSAAQWATVTKVDKDSFTVKQTSDGSDTDGVSYSLVNYIVMEVGVHYINNMKVVVGKITASGVYTNYTFASNFTSVPVVVASPQTNNMQNTEGGARTRIRDIGSSYITLQLEENKTNPGSGYLETVGYIAVSPGYDLLSGLQGVSTGSSYNHKWNAISLSPIFLSAPIVVAQMITENGGNPAYTVLSDISSTTFKVSIEEPGYQDGPHAREAISYLALPAGDIEGSSL